MTKYRLFGGLEATRPPFSGPRVARRRIAGMLFAAIWLYPLIGTARDIARGLYPYPWLAGIGLAIFAGLYLFTIILGFARSEVRPPLWHQVVLWSLAVLTFALAAWYADEPGNGAIGLTIYVAVAGAAIYRIPGGGFWALGVVAVTYLIGWANGVPRGDLGGYAFSTIMSSALVLVVTSMIALIRELRATRQALADAAVEQERLRFARDLHDLLGHTLSLIVVKAEVARRLADRDPAATAQAAGEIEEIGRRALADVREAVSGYRVRGFADELRDATATLADAGVAATVSPVPSTLPADVDNAFAWVIREATTNIIRHSGATACTVTINEDGDAHTLRIADNGRGGNVGVTGFGLRGLRERLEAIGGTLTTLAQHGFTVVATVPAEVKRS
jgi:two-component system sensor histidine kinase DesK